MIIDHVKVFTEDKKFTDGGIVIKNGTIEQVYTEGKRPQTEDEVLDGKGMYAIPGLIDLHFHGCKGDDFCDGSRDAIARIAEYEASVGVTAIAPATMTLPVEELEQILRVAAEYKKVRTVRKRRILSASTWRDLLSVLPRRARRMREISFRVM